MLIIPSFYFAYIMLQQRKYTNKVELFIQQELTEKGYTVIYERLLQNRSPKQLELAFLAKKISNREIETLSQSMQSFGIDNTELIIRQDSLDIRTSILDEINQ